MPPVKRYGSSWSSVRNFLPMDSIVAPLSPEAGGAHVGRLKRGRPWQLEQGLGAVRAVARGLELIGAGAATGRSALDAAEMFIAMVNRGAAPATCSHGNSSLSGIDQGAA